MTITTASRPVTKVPFRKAPRRPGFLSTSTGRILIIVIVALLAADAFGWYRSTTAQPTATYRTQPVTRGTVMQTVNVSGSAAPGGQVSLVFDVPGQVAQVLVTVGQSVQPGTPLVKLETASLEQALTNAQQSLANAQASYQKQVFAAQQTQSSLVAAQQSAATDLAAAQGALAKLQRSYLLAKTSFASNADAGVTGITGFQGRLDAIQLQVEAIIAEMRLIVGGGDTGDLRNALNAMMAVNSPALQNARSSSDALLAPALTDYRNTRVVVFGLIASYDSAIAAGNDTSAISYQFTLMQSGYTMATTRLLSAFDATTSVLSSVQTAVTSAQASLNTQTTRDLHVPFDQWRADLAALYDVVAGAQQDVATAKLELSQATTYLATIVDAAGGGIANAEDNVVTTQQRGQQAIDSAQNAVAIVPLNLQSASISVQSAQTAVDVAQANLGAAVLSAPSAGLITALNVVVGQNVAAGGTSAIAVLSSPTAIVVHGTVGEANVAKLKIGQDANVTMDALGAAQKITGKVTAIDYAATISSGVPVYGVDVTVASPPAGIRSGMTGTAQIILASKTNVLVVPNLAIRTQAGKRFVQVMKNGVPTDTDATFGITNGQVTEVTSGLSEGDVIVIPQTTTPPTQTPGGNIPGIRF